MTIGFTAQQIRQLEAVVEKAVKEAFADVGLRIESDTHEDEARADFVFLRKLRRSWDHTGTRIGNAVLVAAIAAAASIASAGIWALFRR